MALSKPETVPSLFNKSPKQVINDKGRLQTTKKGWILRFITLSAIIATIVFNIQQGIQYYDPLIMYSTLMPIHAFMIMGIGWFFFHNGHRVKLSNELVSVIVPIYNQDKMIETVIGAIFDSTYHNIEVIAVNDGSKDKTKNILDSLKLVPEYKDRLKVIHKTNEGKRKAVATGFYASKADYIVLIDSDSVIDKNAISELMKTLLASKNIGAVVGEAKVWNASKNFFTKCQDVWYDYAFNIHKTTESVFNTVLCCSGCLAAYRKEAINNFIPYWIDARIQNSDDRDLTTFAYAPPNAKEGLAPSGNGFLEKAAKYDDAEDRLKTGWVIGKEYKTLYVPKAVVYTDVPESFKGYIRQQTRWKKGYIRSNFFVSSFFWQKNPLMALIFYTEFMAAFTTPLITIIVLFYEPFILNHPIITFVFITGSLLIGLAQGLDYKCRVPEAKYWYYKPIMNLLTSFILSWLVIPALLRIRKNEWMTR